MRPFSPEGQRRELGILQIREIRPDSPTTSSMSKKEANSAVTQPAAIAFVTTEHFTLRGHVPRPSLNRSAERACSLRLFPVDWSPLG